MKSFISATLLFAITAYAAPTPGDGPLGASAIPIVPALVLPNTTAAAVTTVVGATGLLQGSCSPDWSCTVTASGKITDLLADGASVAAGSTQVAAWCSGGHCWANVTLAGTGAIPLNISCDSASGACTGVAGGSITALLANGQQVEAWGWLTPTGYCRGGTCTGSVNFLGDPAY